MKKGKNIIKNLSFLIIVLSFVIISYGFRPSRSYGYDYYEQITAAPPAYHFGKQLTPSELNMDIIDISDPLYDSNSETKVVDFLVFGEYKIFASDKAIYLYDSNFVLKTKMRSFTTSDGQTISFQAISSIAGLNNTLYIADIPIGKTFASIYVFNFDEVTKTFHYTNAPLSLNASSNVPGLEDKGFRPTKIAVSKTGAIYSICENIIEGIIEIDNNSHFKRYLGTNKIELSTLEQFWRKISPKSASGKKTYVPADFSSLVVDDKGFIYTTTAAKGNKPIQKLNFKGENVLVENGNTKVVGDIFPDSKDSSTFIDIDVNDYGVFLALDSGLNNNSVGEKPGRKIFAYNNSGDLLYIIGHKGENSFLAFQEPKIVRWDKNNIIVIDSQTRIHYLEPTEYGKLINEATRLYNFGKFDEALPYWQKLIELNSNNELAHIGIGKVNLRKGNYGEAMENFKAGNSRLHYSKAYEKVRNERLARTIIPIVISVIVIAVIYKGVIVWIEKKY